MRWLIFLGVWFALMLAINGAVRIAGLQPGVAIGSVLLMAALASFLLSNRSSRREKAHRDLLEIAAAEFFGLIYRQHPDPRGNFGKLTLRLRLTSARAPRQSCLGWI